MISREQAQEQLKAFYNPNHSKEQVARLVRLPSKLSTIGQILIQDGPEWKKLEKNHEQGKRFHHDVTQDLASLTSKQRKILFSAILPGIAPYLGDTWDLFDELPYQEGFSRRPFRSPDQPLPDARASMLQRLVFSLRGYEQQDILWLAAWAPYLGYYGSDAPGHVFAAAINRGDKAGNEVFDILVSSANGTHEIGGMGRHVVRGLICSTRVDGWECIERMLLAAQREEGLRQAIMESIDEAHPQAFRRILRLTLDQKLVRFSAVVRAFSVWFGLPFEAVNQKTVHNILEQILVYLDSPSECQKAVKIRDAQTTYYALWAMAFDDVQSALPYALTLSRSSDVEKRFAATHLLVQTSLKEILPDLLHLLNDEDLRIVAHVLSNVNGWIYGNDVLSKSDLFERLEKLIPRINHKQSDLQSLVWDWMPIPLKRESISGMLVDCLGDRSPKRLIPYLSRMNPNDRGRVVRILGEMKKKDREILDIFLLLVGDASPYVRGEALKGLRDIKLLDSDIAQLENLLSRKSQDLRRGIIQLLSGLPDQTLVESLGRLLKDNGENQHLAALEIMKECKQKDRISRQVDLLAVNYKEQAEPSAAEIVLLNGILSQTIETYTLDDSLGLMNPQNRTQPVPIKTSQSRKIKLGSSAAIACLKSLDTLVEEHRNDEVQIHKGGTKAVELLGNIQSSWMLYSANHWQSIGKPDFSLVDFPLKDLVEDWWRTRSKNLRDDDGYELIRAYAAISLFGHNWHYGFSRQDPDVSRDIQKHFDLNLNFKMNYKAVVETMIEWLLWSHPVKGDAEFILDALEESVARIPYSELTGMKKEPYWSRKTRAIQREKLAYLEITRWHRNYRLASWKDQHHVRLWNVVCWLNEPKPDLPGGYAELDDLLFAYKAGGATRDDLLHMFLGPIRQDEYGRHHLLSQFSGRKLDPRAESEYEKFPIIKEIVDTCRERILDIECKRGELPTAASEAASGIRSVPGVRNLVRMLVAMGSYNFERGHLYGQSRSGVFSHLIRSSYPLDTDRVEDFIEQVHVHLIPEKRLIELAMYAPQWAEYVQKAINWEHLTDAVWWLYAHTKDRQWMVDREIREEWAARISEHTPLTADDLMDGAVDVAWFRRAYVEMGEKRWGELYSAALYTSNGIGHTRARLFSDAMLGRVTPEQLTERIKKKRHQDSVRALGLIPLTNTKDPKSELLQRYEVMQEFWRTGKKFGSQRQASEKLAVSVGMQNLARTAGYTDPQRLEWAMEIESISDLSAGPVNVTVDDYQSVLSINDLGEPILETTKNGKAIKTIPSKIKKKEAVVNLFERKRVLDRQVSRMRVSLEQAMCREDHFSGSELKVLFHHPMLRVMLEQLVFISPRGLGYPIESGIALLQHDGKRIKLKDNDQLSIAHSLDLLNRPLA
jgi:HEAT repeat protein